MTNGSNHTKMTAGEYYDREMDKALNEPDPREVRERLIAAENAVTKKFGDPTVPPETAEQAHERARAKLRAEGAEALGRVAEDDGLAAGLAEALGIRIKKGHKVRFTMVRAEFEYQIAALSELANAEPDFWERNDIQITGFMKTGHEHSITSTTPDAAMHAYAALRVMWDKGWEETAKAYGGSLASQVFTELQKDMLSVEEFEGAFFMSQLLYALAGEAIQAEVNKRMPPELKRRNEDVAK